VDANTKDATATSADSPLKGVYLDTSVYCWIATQVDAEAAYFLRAAAAEMGVRVLVSQLVLIELLSTSDERERDHLVAVACRLADRTILPDFDALVALAAAAARGQNLGGETALLLRSRAAEVWEEAHDDPAFRLQLDDRLRESLQQFKLVLATVLAASRAGADVRDALGSGDPTELKARLRELRARPGTRPPPETVSATLWLVAGLILYSGLSLDPEPIDEFWRLLGAKTPEERAGYGPDFLGAVMACAPMCWLLDYLEYHAARGFDRSTWLDGVHVSYAQFVDELLTCDGGMIAYGRAQEPDRVLDGRAFAAKLTLRARELALDHRRRLVRDACGDVARCLELHCLARRLVAENRLAEAEPAFREALQLARETNDAHAYTAILSNMAPVFRDLGDLESAEELLVHAIPIVRSINDRAALALLFVQLGCILDRKDDRAGARALYEDAAAVASGLEDPVPMCAALDKIARQRAWSGELDPALQTWKRAIARLDGFEEAELLAGIEVNVAAALSAGGRRREGYDVLQRAIKRLRRAGSRRSLAVAIGRSADAATTSRQQRQAVESAIQAVRLLVEFGSYDDAITVLSGRVDALGEPADLPVALQAFYLAAATRSPTGILAGSRILREHDPSEEIFGVIATTIAWLAREADGNPPEPGPLEMDAACFMEICAHVAGVRDHDGFIAWAERERLRDPRMFVPRLQAWIRGRVPREEWLFDPDAAELRWANHDVAAEGADISDAGRCRVEER
jgi:tetratricopeptide (TPR) repeat protein